MFSGSLTPYVAPFDAGCVMYDSPHGNSISAMTNVNALMHGKHNFPLQEMASESRSMWKTHKVAKSNHPSENPV